MTIWRSFGSSVIGPSHINAARGNQDAWLSFHPTWGDGIVVSDGLGSKQFSDFGSRAACLAVARAVYALREETEIDHLTLCDQIRVNWLSLVVPLDPLDCAATCLFAFRLGDGTFRLGMLGDGLAAAVMRDGSLASISEDKSGGFSNITSALSPKVSRNDWRHLSLPEDECSAVLLCTDGVSDDLDNADGFVKEFIEAHRDLAFVTANRRVREMLECWPTPKHSDDKTIACLCRQEVTE